MKLFNVRQKGALYAMASGLLYGLVGYFGMSIIKADHSASNMTFWRFLMASLVMGILLLPKIKVLRENYLEMIKMVIYGGIFYGAGSILYFISSQYIGTGLSMVIFFTYPAIVMFLNWLIHKKKITKIYYLSIIIIAGGLVLLSSNGEFRLDAIGISLSILYAILYSFYMIFSKYTKLPALVSTFMVSIGCAIAGLIFALIDGSLTVPNTTIVWLNILAMAVVCTAAPILLLLEGLKHTSAEKASILSVLEPVFVVIFGMILLGETMSGLQAIGVATVLVGAIITLLIQAE